MGRVLFFVFDFLSSRRRLWPSDSVARVSFDWQLLRFFFGSNKNQILFRFFFLLFLSGVFEDYEFWRADSFGLVDSLLIGGRAAARESLASPVVFLFLSTILWILTANRLCLVDRVWSAAKMCRGNLWRPPSLLLLGIDEDSWGFFQCWNRIFFFISFRRLGLPAELLLTNLWYPPFSFVHDVFFLSEVILDCWINGILRNPAILKWIQSQRCRLSRIPRNFGSRTDRLANVAPKWYWRIPDDSKASYKILKNLGNSLKNKERIVNNLW